MPRVPLTVQHAAKGGATLTFAAATANDCFVPNIGRLLLINNTSGSAVTITIPSTEVIDGLVVPNRTITAATSAITVAAFGNHAPEALETDGTVWINYSSVTGVTVALVEAL